LGVVYYRLQSIQTALETFQSAIKKFSSFPEIYNYYGEILLDLQKFDEAEENFKKGIVLIFIKKIICSLFFFFSSFFSN